MTRTVHFVTVPDDGSVHSEIVPSGVEILSAMWRQNPEQPNPAEGDVVLYIERPVTGREAYRGERKLKVFLVATGKAFDQADFAFVGTVRQPGGGRNGGSGFWHVYACQTEVDA